MFVPRDPSRSAQKFEKANMAAGMRDFAGTQLFRELGRYL